MEVDISPDVGLLEQEGGSAQPQQFAEAPPLQTVAYSERLNDKRQADEAGIDLSAEKSKRAKVAVPPEEHDVLQDHNHDRTADSGASDSCVDEAGSDDDEQEEVLERVVSAEQAEADLAAIRGMWELAAVYDFLSTFKYWCNFTQLYPLQDLEEALVKSAGPGLLAQMHIDLLRGIATRSQVGPTNWASTLSARLLSEAHAMQQPPTRLPFRPVRGKEARDYAHLSAVQRVLTLKALCDLRADREDMRNLVDDIMRGALGPDKPKASSGTNTPPRRSARGSSVPPPPLTAADMRGRVPLGQDATGNSYHWYDMPYDHDAPVGLMGSRLYIEGPPQEPSLQQQAEQKQLDGPQHHQQQQQPVKQEAAEAATASRQQASATEQVQQQHIEAAAVVKEEAGEPAAAAAADMSGKPPRPLPRPASSAGTAEPAAPGAASKPGSPPHVKPEPGQAQQQNPDGVEVEQQAATETTADRPGESQGRAQQQQQQQPHGGDDQAAAAAAAAAAADQAREVAAAAEGGDTGAHPADRQGAAVEPPADAAPKAKSAGGVGEVVDEQGGADAVAGSPEAGARADADAAGTATADGEGDGDTTDGEADGPHQKSGRGRSKAALKQRKTGGGKAGSRRASSAAASEDSSQQVPASRPGRKAAAAASAKFAKQLTTKAQHSSTSEDSGGGTAAAAAAEARAASSKGRGRGSSRLSSASGADEAAAPAATAAPGASGAGGSSSKKGGRGNKAPGSARKRARSPSLQPEGDAAMAQLLSGGRPTRRAAADAAAKIAVQSQNVSISKLAVEAAAAERAAAGAGQSGGGRTGRTAGGSSGAGGGGSKPGGGSGRGKKQHKPKGPYVLPLDLVAGSWHLAADDIESVQALGEALSKSAKAADVEVGQLLLQQVVATLLERKQHEEKYARARSRVAKSLGLDAPVLQPGARAARQRKVVRYDFDDYDRHMRSAIRAAERGGLPELPPGPSFSRQPYTAPPYDVDVRRGRSGGPLDGVEMIESEAALMRQRRAEKEKEKALLQELEAAAAQQDTAHDGLAGDQQGQQQQLQGQQEQGEQLQGQHEQGERLQAVAEQQGQQQHESAPQQPAEQAEQASQQMWHPSVDKTSGVAADAEGYHAPAAGAATAGKQRIKMKKQHHAAVAAVAEAAARPESEYTDSPVAGATAAGSGRPRRRAAAGVSNAVAAAAAAESGAEDAFLGAAAFMEQELVHHHAELHISQQQPHAGAGQQRGLGRQQQRGQGHKRQRTQQQQQHQQQYWMQQAEQQQHYGTAGLYDGSYAASEGQEGLLPPHGHFHSSSTHSFTGMADQQQQQQPLQLSQLDYMRDEPASWAQQGYRASTADGGAVPSAGGADAAVLAAAAAAAGEAGRQLPMQPQWQMQQQQFPNSSQPSPAQWLPVQGDGVSGLGRTQDPDGLNSTA